MIAPNVTKVNSSLATAIIKYDDSTKLTKHISLQFQPFCHQLSSSFILLQKGCNRLPSRRCSHVDSNPKNFVLFGNSFCFECLPKLFLTCCYVSTAKFSRFWEVMLIFFGCFEIDEVLTEIIITNSTPRVQCVILTRFCTAFYYRVTMFDTATYKQVQFSLSEEFNSQRCRSE